MESVSEMLQTLLSTILSLLAEPAPLVEGRWMNVSFDVPILVAIDEPVFPVLRLIYVVECALIAIGMLLMVYFNHFVNRSGIIHLNLQFLFVCSTSLYIVASFARFYMIMVQFQIVTDLNTLYLLLAGLIRLEHYGLSLSAVLVVTVERTFATWFVVDYEKKKRTWVAWFSLTVGLIYTQFFVIPICFYKAPLYYIISYSSIWAVLAAIALCGLQRFNVRESKRLSWKAENVQKRKTVNYTLSKKFQVEENVKVIRLLQAMSFMLVFLIFVVILFIVIPRVYLGTGTFAGQIVISLFDINLALGAIIIPGVSIWQLRKTRDLPFTQNIYCLNMNVNKKRREERQVNPITVFEDATNTYFEQFQTSWR